MSEANSLLGHWTCPLGGRAEVFQTKKRGNHFYTRCKCCGLVQGTGASRQQRIYDEAEFLPEVTFKVPSNVKAEPEKDAIETQANAEALPSDFDPTEQPEVSEPEVTKPMGTGVKTGLALLAFSAAVGVAAWMN